ncbi:hypothetical protein Tco_1201851 [Tanacetum coccineum]
MGIISDIQQLICGFLWCNGEYRHGKAKVSWDDIYLPKREGGLGLRSLEVFNLALMTTHIWNIVSNKESLWGSLKPNFGLIAAPNLEASSQDIMRWCDFNGNMSEFSVKCAWEALRPRGHEVWYFVRRLAGFEHVPPILEDIMMCFHPMAAKRVLFKNTRRSPEELRDLIIAQASYFQIQEYFEGTKSALVMEDAFEF